MTGQKAEIIAMTLVNNMKEVKNGSEEALVSFMDKEETNADVRRIIREFCDAVVRYETRKKKR